jgi:hypothetical protein
VRWHSHLREIGDFDEDCRAGRLPAVSLITPEVFTDEGEFEDDQLGEAATASLFETGTRFVGRLRSHVSPGRWPGLRRPHQSRWPDQTDHCVSLFYSRICCHTRYHRGTTGAGNARNLEPRQWPGGQGRAAGVTSPPRVSRTRQPVLTWVFRRLAGIRR